jgi:hypothetical protein
MAITLEAHTGSAVTVGTTAISMINGTTTIATNTTPGLYQAFVDTINLAAGDAFEWSLLEKTITGGTQRLVTSCQVANVPGYPIWASPAFALGIGWDMTLKKLAGTDRTLTWRISRIT